MSQDLGSVASAPVEPPLSRWEVWTSAILHPSVATFERLVSNPAATGGRAALNWIYVSALLYYAIYRFARILYDPESAREPVAMLGGIAGAAFLLWLGLVISIWITQAIARRLGGTGANPKLIYAVAAYLAPLITIVALIRPFPYVSLLVFPLVIYGLALNVMAVKAVNQFGWGKAIASNSLIILETLGFAISFWCTQQIAGVVAPTVAVSQPTAIVSSASEATALPAPLPALTSISAPLAERDLCSVLRAADVPSEFSSVQRLTGVDEYKDAYSASGYQDVLTDLVNAQHVLFYTPDEIRSIGCDSFVYQSEGSARRAMRAIRLGMIGDTFDIRPLGNESRAVKLQGQNGSLVDIVWRYREAVVEMSWLSTQETTSMETLRLANETLRLAQLVQAQMEGREK